MDAQNFLNKISGSLERISQDNSKSVPVPNIILANSSLKEKVDTLNFALSQSAHPDLRASIDNGYVHISRADYIPNQNFAEQAIFGLSELGKVSFGAKTINVEIKISNSKQKSLESVDNATQAFMANLQSMSKSIKSEYLSPLASEILKGQEILRDKINRGTLNAGTTIKLNYEFVAPGEWLENRTITAQKKASSAKSVSGEVEADVDFYKVKGGDNTWKILQREYGFSNKQISDILRAKDVGGIQVLVNGETRKNYSNIRVGDKITVVQQTSQGGTIIPTLKQREEQKKSQEELLATKITPATFEPSMKIGSLRQNEQIWPKKKSEESYYMTPEELKKAKAAAKERYLEQTKNSTAIKGLLIGYDYENMAREYHPSREDMPKVGRELYRPTSQDFVQTKAPEKKAPQNTAEPKAAREPKTINEPKTEKEALRETKELSNFIANNTVIQNSVDKLSSEKSVYLFYDDSESNGYVSGLNGLNGLNKAGSLKVAPMQGEVQEFVILPNLDSKDPTEVQRAKQLQEKYGPLLYGMDAEGGRYINLGMLNAEEKSWIRYVPSNDFDDMDKTLRNIADSQKISNADLIVISTDLFDINGKLISKDALDYYKKRVSKDSKLIITVADASGLKAREQMESIKRTLSYYHSAQKAEPENRKDIQKENIAPLEERLRDWKTSVSEHNKFVNKNIKILKSVLGDNVSIVRVPTSVFEKTTDKREGSNKEVVFNLASYLLDKVILRQPGFLQEPSPASSNISTSSSEFEP